MKVVKKLKKKHRSDLWLDRDGVLWFFDAAAHNWYFLELSFPPGPGFTAFETVEIKGWPDGPFVRVKKKRVHS